MTEIQLTKNNHSYHFGFTANLSHDQLQELLTHLCAHKTADSSISGGRAPVTATVIKDLGPVVIKQFMRGGTMRFILKNRYLKFGKTRSRVEFESMSKLRQLGIRAPEPVAYAYRGFPLYFAWLVTREIINSCTLAELSCQDIGRASHIMDSVIEQIDRLVECRFIHVDLHPGNILVDSDDNIYIIDFDRGHIYRGSETKLRNRYLNRWHRAVSKHGLPDLLAEKLRSGLN
jgi:3-deoxy-D-manno-octulosonic acid kinase